LCEFLGEDLFLQTV